MPARTTHGAAGHDRQQSFHAGEQLMLTGNTGCLPADPHLRGRRIVDLVLCAVVIEDLHSVSNRKLMTSGISKSGTGRWPSTPACTCSWMPPTARPQVNY